MKNINRREALKMCVMGTTGAVVSGCIDYAFGKNDSYSVLLIGDTHYDSAPESLYHSDYPGEGVSEGLAKIQRAEFARNAEMWAERLPRLLKAAKNARRSDTAFAIQVGDLIQGDCNNPVVHSKMADDAFDYLQKAIGEDLPLRIVVGNHDIRNGCRDDMGETYRKWMSEKMSVATGKKTTSSNFHYFQGPDLWIHVDFTHPSLDAIKAALAEGDGARHTFLVTHGPVIPCNVRFYDWMLFGYGDNERRRELRSLLLKRNAIVIAGHTHTTGLSEIKAEGGKITQIVVNSVWKEEKFKEFNAEFSTPAEYVSGNCDKKKEAFLGEYKPMLSRFVQSRAAGFMRLEVSSDDVTAVFFGGDGRESKNKTIFRV